MTPELQRYAEQFRAIREEADQLVAPLTREQFNWRPGPDRWSIGECLTHLIVTAKRAGALMDEQIRRGKADGISGSGEYSYGWFSRWFEGQLEPPPKRRFKSPAPFLPALGSTLDPATILGEFHQVGDHWLEQLRHADGLDLKRIKVRSAASPLFRFPLGAQFRINLAHERRHLWQARQVLAAPSFPR